MIRRIILSLSAILLLTSSLLAQPGRSMNWQLGVGISNPTGDLGEGWSTGFHGRGALIFPTSTVQESNTSVGFLAELAYHSFPLDDLGLDVSGGTLSSILIGGGAVVYFAKENAPTRFFLMGTLGLGVVDISDIEGFAVFDGESKIYFNPSVGVQIGKTVYVSAGYVSIALSGSPATFFPITLGVSL